jgi:hypothetical protein
VIKQLEKYCSPADKRPITSQPWTTTIEGENITFATNGHIIVTITRKLKGCQEYPEKIAAENEPCFTRKDWNKKIKREELKRSLPGSLWPSEKKDCPKCLGLGKIDCGACFGSGTIECGECCSEIPCGCDDGEIDCTGCVEISIPVNCVWLNSTLVNGVYLSRALEVLKGIDIFFYLPDDPYQPICLSDGENRVSLMPRRQDDSDDGAPRIELNQMEDKPK